jgi:hypothetical protein
MTRKSGKELVEPRGIELHPEHHGFLGFLFPKVNLPTLQPTLKPI